jgi:hypothetical protein
MCFSQAECLFEEALLRGGLVEQRQDQDPYEFLKALLLSAGSSAGAAGGCGQASAHHDGLHEDHQSGGPIWRPWQPLHSSRLFLNGVRTPLFAEYVTQHMGHV